MKKLLYLITIISIGTVNQTRCTEYFYPAAWGCSAVLELLTLASREVRHVVYGNSEISDLAEKNLYAAIDNLGLSKPTDIKRSHSLWPMMAGTIYSNHESLFLSKEIADQLDKGSSLNDQAKHELMTALLMINSHFDRKIVAAYLAVPIIIWIVCHGIKALIEKNKLDKDSLLGTLSTIATTQNKAFFSALLIGAFSMYQRHSISKIIIR